MTYTRFQFDPFCESGQYALEQQMAQVAREADGLEWLAWVHDQNGRADDAEVAMDMSDARWRAYRELNRELDTIETGW